jgi:periplasmic copper chaperone A
MKLIANKSINTSVAVIFLLFLSVAMSFHAVAQNTIADVAVKDAWVRTSVPGQKASGAFMTLTSKTELRLVGASSPVAGVTEVHEMKMNGDVMQMRAVPSLDLPAGKAVALRPGGFHIMLLDLKAALPKDSTVPLTLMFKDAKGVESKVELMVPVAVASPATKGADAVPNQHKH